MTELEAFSTKYLRQQLTADPSKFKYPVTILGCGSHGSIVAIGCAKLGVANMTLIDFDTFESHNVPNQFCCESGDLGRYKVDALSDLCVAMGARQRPYAFPYKLCDDRNMRKESPSQRTLIAPAKNMLKGIVVSTPDNMVARKTLLSDVVINTQTPWLIDSRQAGFHVVIRVINTMDTDQVRAYIDTLYTDAEATPELCGARSVIDTTLHVGAHILSIIRVLQTTGESPVRMIDLDISKGEQTIVLPNGQEVSNREQLALATAV